ncbi:hypothetical protein EDC01DRAFT_669520 [Geopyxis carbonaria]|nr:hypothetical protein EDC01DRAFT_669520 [Geopyxis carbonaria]
MGLAHRLNSEPPVNYVVPPFPSLYWPVEPSEQQAKYLYAGSDIWRFTLYWTLLVFAAFHLTSGFYAFFMHRSKTALGFPLIFAIIGGIEAAISGSVVGLLLGAVYKAGYFRMSTWIPLVWAVVNVLVLVVSSFSLQGGL